MLFVRKKRKGREQSEQSEQSKNITKEFGAFRVLCVFRGPVFSLWFATTLDSCVRTLLSGIIIAKFANTAIQCGFTHVSIKFGL